MGKKRDEDEVLEVMERHDPEVEGDVWGDPRVEFEIEGLADDLHALSVHQGDIGMYKARGYREARHQDDGITFKCGLTGDKGEAMVVRDHTIMVGPRDLHERRRNAERAANRKARGAMLAKKNLGGTTFVNSPGAAGPRAMFQR